MTVYKIKPAATNDVLSDYQQDLTKYAVTAEVIYNDVSRQASVLIKNAGVEEFRYSFNLWSCNNKTDLNNELKEAMEQFVLEYKRRRFMQNVLGDVIPAVQ